MTDKNREVKNHDYIKQWLTFIVYFTHCSKNFICTTTTYYYYYYHSHFREEEIHLPRSHQVTKIGFESVP